MNNLAILDHKISVLRARFIEQLPERIRTLAQTLPAAASDPDAVRELERAFHSLAGIAGTYVIDDVFALAAAGEALCVKAVDGRLDGERLQEARMLVVRLHAVSVALMA